MSSSMDRPCNSSEQTLQRVSWLADQLASAADRAFVPQSLAAGIRAQFACVRSLSIAFPVPCIGQTLLVCLGDLSCAGYKSLVMLQPDESEYGYGLAVHRSALAQPHHQTTASNFFAAPACSHLALSPEVPASVNSATVLAAELHESPADDLRETEVCLSALAAALGACLAAHACSVPAAAAVFLGLQDALRIAPEVRGTCTATPRPDHDSNDASAQALRISTHRAVEQEPHMRQPHSAELPSEPLQPASSETLLTQLSQAPWQDLELDVCRDQARGGSQAGTCMEAVTAASVSTPSGGELQHGSGALKDISASASGARNDSLNTPKHAADYHPASTFTEAPRKPKQAHTTAVDGRQHPFWLTFCDKQMEAEFADHYSHQVRLIELLYYFPMLYGLWDLCFVRKLSAASDASFASKHPLATLLLCAFVVPYATRMMYYQWYVRHRDAIISAIRLFNTCVWVLSVVPFILSCDVDTDSPDSSKAWWSLFSTASMLLYLMLSPLLLLSLTRWSIMQIRFRSCLPTQAAITAVYMAHVKGLCTNFFPRSNALMAYASLSLAYVVLGVLIPCAAVRSFEHSSRIGFVFRKQQRQHVA